MTYIKPQARAYEMDLYSLLCSKGCNFQDILYLWNSRHLVFMDLYYYVYMSSDGLHKRDSPFWRHSAVRFTCLRVMRRLVNKGLYGVKACMLMYRFHKFGNCCPCLSWTRCCQLWIMPHTVKSTRQHLCRMCKVTGRQILIQVSESQCWKTVFRTALLHVSANG